jgi:ammonium transporter, Amt family
MEMVALKRRLSVVRGSWMRATPLALLLALVFAKSTFAQESEPITAELAYYAIDNIFLLIAAILVLFMQAGFAMVEAGFNSRKNTVNILFKNTMDLCFGAIIFWIVGYNIMYGESILGGFLAWGGFGIDATMDPALAGPGVLHPQVDWLFQAAFAATAATIVSGAVAGRMKVSAYLVYSVILTGLVYPIAGFWTWGGGWLSELGFHDFAGSLLVHSVGGFAGLAGAMVLGPRIGRFTGKRNPLPAHSITIATLGVFILIIGWYGFNPGSQLAFSGTANIEATMLIAVNTTLAACAGGVFSILLAWYIEKKPDLGYGLNGILAGLVGITANADMVSNASSLAIGGIAGLLVVGGMLLLEKLKIDDPVGAWPVHGLCGVWGGVAAGIFGTANLGVQILGSLVYPVWSFVLLFGLFSVMKALGSLRVTAEEEKTGLDVVEHGMVAYAGD